MIFKSKFLFFIFLLVIFIVCCDNNTNIQQIGSICEDDYMLCFDSEFYKTVKTYIYKNGWELKLDSSFIKPYYSIFFFNHDSIFYFTIWTSPFFPNTALEKNLNTSNIHYSSLKIENSQIILITNQGDSIAKKFYGECVPLIDTICCENKNIEMIYDGRLYIETYTYYLDNGKYTIKQLECPIADFLGNPPKIFW